MKKQSEAKGSKSLRSTPVWQFVKDILSSGVDISSEDTKRLVATLTSLGYYKVSKDDFVISTKSYLAEMESMHNAGYAAGVREAKRPFKVGDEVEAISIPYVGKIEDIITTLETTTYMVHSEHNHLAFSADAIRLVSSSAEKASLLEDMQRAVFKKVDNLNRDTVKTVCQILVDEGYKK